MKLLTNIALAALIAFPAVAQEQTVLERWEEDRTQVFDGAEITLDELNWVARPLVVFADTPNDPRFQQQMDLLLADMEQLAVRDVIVITDTDRTAMTDLRTTLRPRGYMMALIGKDGRVALRKPSPYSVRELSRSIDKMPLRQQEISDRRSVSE
ncbi:uncharacterized protein DUF4174 [Yoonia maricola]|uniref:Uncharacterized protein DUF4174 n=1 Tax=Yoonia maricola TaxID=420999 RepID=A0A2M8WNN9_9RHOB|nr:DUF4174 domain-containing protein [Yoonia maricola]PJI92539.1 uncharacterized protein DUF4174 [Yoonia maricola]